jgi:hypothetical protein
MPDPEFVEIASWAEFKETSPDTEDTTQVPWARWAAMTAAERERYLSDIGQETSNGAGSYGVEVRGPEPEPAPDLPPMPTPAVLAEAIRAARAEAVALELAGWKAGEVEQRSARDDWDERHPALAAVLVHEEARAVREQAREEGRS